MKKENYKKAIECYKKSIIYNPDNGATWSNLMLAYYGTEQYDKAEMCRKRAKKLKQYDQKKEEDEKQQQSLRERIEENKGYFI